MGAILMIPWKTRSVEAVFLMHLAFTTGKIPGLRVGADFSSSKSEAKEADRAIWSLSS